jgi:hypothetical protein
VRTQGDAVPGNLVPQFASADEKFVEDYNNACIIVDSGAANVKTKPAPMPQTTPSK